MKYIVKAQSKIPSLAVVFYQPLVSFSTSRYAGHTLLKTPPLTLGGEVLFSPRYKIPSRVGPFCQTPVLLSRRDDTTILNIAPRGGRLWEDMAVMSWLGLLALLLVDLRGVLGGEFFNGFPASTEAEIAQMHAVVIAMSSYYFVSFLVFIFLN